MVDSKKINKKVESVNQTIKTIKFIEKTTKFTLDIVDHATDGKVSKKMDEIQEKIDQSFGNKGESKLENLQMKIDQSIGQKIESKVNQLEQFIDNHGGQLLEKTIQKSAENIEKITQALDPKNIIPVTKQRVNKIESTIKNMNKSQKKKKESKRIIETNEKEKIN